jgi:hypothetical protein
MYAGITIMHYPPKRTDDVYRHIREVLVPHHQQMQSQGLRDALFLVNPESCQGIGIAIWDNPDKLREIEQGNTRDMARAMRDGSSAPTEYTRLRAQWVEDLSGGIVSTDWYEVVGRASSGSILFPTVPGSGGGGTYAGVTIMHYPPKRTDDVYRHIREVLAPHHQQMQSEGLKDSLFLVNPESCQGIGIAIWDDPNKLREIEQGTSREMARAMRDSETAPTDYTRMRAAWVEELGGGIVSTDWYEVVGRVPSAGKTAAPKNWTTTTKGKGKAAPTAPPATSPSWP